MRASTSRTSIRSWSPASGTGVQATALPSQYLQTIEPMRSRTPYQPVYDQRTGTHQVAPCLAFQLLARPRTHRRLHPRAYPETTAAVAALRDKAQETLQHLQTVCRTLLHLSQASSRLDQLTLALVSLPPRRRRVAPIMAHHPLMRLREAPA